MSLKQFYMAGFMALVSINANAQLSGLYSTSFTWKDKPVLHSMPENFKTSSAVYLADNRILNMCTPVIYGSMKILSRYRRLYQMPDWFINQSVELRRASLLTFSRLAGSGLIFSHWLVICVAYGGFAVSIVTDRF